MANQIKFGLNQVGSPAPIGWRRWERLFIIVILPLFATFVHTWGFEAALISKLDLIGILVGSAVKGIGMILGNGQTYADVVEEVVEETVKDK